MILFAVADDAISNTVIISTLAGVVGVLAGVIWKRSNQDIVRIRELEAQNEAQAAACAARLAENTEVIRAFVELQRK